MSLPPSPNAPSAKQATGAARYSATLLEKAFVQHLHDWWFLWWNNFYLMCVTIILLALPSSHSVAMWKQVALQTYLRLKWPLILTLLLTAAFTAVIAGIVLRSLGSFGFASLALPLLLRALLLEVMPLGASIVVAIKVSIPLGLELSKLRRHKQLRNMEKAGADVLATELLPRLLMGFYASTMLTAFGSILTMLMLYLRMYGFTTAGFEGYTHTFSAIMTPSFALAYLIKVCFFGFVVGLLPLSSAIYDARYGLRVDTELANLARMLTILLLIEVVCLAFNYL